MAWQYEEIKEFKDVNLTSKVQEHLNKDQCIAARNTSSIIYIYNIVIILPIYP